MTESLLSKVNEGCFWNTKSCIFVFKIYNVRTFTLPMLFLLVIFFCLFTFQDFITLLSEIERLEVCLSLCEVDRCFGSNLEILGTLGHSVHTFILTDISRLMFTRIIYTLEGISASILFCPLKFLSSDFGLFKEALHDRMVIYPLFV